MDRPRFIASDQPIPGVVVGVMFVQGTGYRVAVLEDGEVRQMSADAAERLAKMLAAEDGLLEELSPVCRSLEKAARILRSYDNIEEEVSGHG